MGEETTWFNLLPGVKNLEAFSRQYLARTHMGIAQFPSGFTLTHVLGVVLVLILGTFGALIFYRAMAKGGEAAIVPPTRLNVRNIFELFADAVFGVMESVMGTKNARQYLPLIGTIAFFIFFSNCLALIPGFIPPTAMLKTNAALALTVFVMTHVYGVRQHGLAYFKHFLGPVLWLAPFMVIIEIISHLARPLSLSVRLLGNMFADHKVVGVFFTLVPILVPVPFLILGVLVCIIQAFVFTLLAMVYIQGAVAEHDHGDEAHAHEAHH
jgi:F-type H+-transporting ATPase subunit a